MTTQDVRTHPVLLRDSVPSAHRLSIRRLIPILPVKTVYNPTKLAPPMGDGGEPMRRLQLEWNEREEDLKRVSLKENDRQTRMRLQALWLVCNGQSIHDGAAAIGGHPRTVQDWVAWYRKGGATTCCAIARAGVVMPAD